MSEMAYVGIDVGSTAIKAAVYGQDGRPISLETRASPVIRLHPGWSEQNMEEVWAITRECLRGAVERAAGARIVSLGVCAQGDGLWALDADLRPVRNAILWNDCRGEDLVLDWIADGTSARLSRFSRTANWAGTAGTALRWLKEHEAETAARVAHVVFCKDWINLRLTGVLASDFSDGTIPFMDLERRVYAAEAFDLLGIGEFAGMLAPPQRSDRLHGGLLAEVAEAVGLPAGLPVATGSIDLGAMMVGMKLNEVDDVCLILGTTAVVNAVVGAEPFAGEPVGATVAHPLNDNWIRVVAPSSGASAYDWFASLHPLTLGGGDTSQIVARMNEVAGSIPAGANGVTFLPFLSGERAPFVAPHATAAFHGLTAQSTKADMARAVMEGTSFSLKHCFRAAGIANSDHVFLTGGGARNVLWCDIVASVMGTTITASNISDHGLWGAALIGAAAAGVGDAQSRPARAEDVRYHHPDPQLAQEYERLFALYQRIVAVSGEIWEARRAFAHGAGNQT